MTAVNQQHQQSSTDLIINLFEAEQKAVVFGALSGYLNTALFADVNLSCRNQSLRAHKVILAASSKFFRDLFKHNPAMEVVDLDKELSPNGLDLSYEEVQLIIGILYCVGTVEISPQRIESLLLTAQVLGIPTLITLLKRIKRTISSTPERNSPLHGQTNQIQGSAQLIQTPYSQPFSLKSGPTFTSTGLDNSPTDEEGNFHAKTSSSPEPFSGVLSLSSPNGGNSRPPSLVNRTNNVLENLDPSFLQHLSNLQANQIDDLESTLMPHLQGNDNRHPSNPLQPQFADEGPSIYNSQNAIEESPNLRDERVRISPTPKTLSSNLQFHREGSSSQNRFSKLLPERNHDLAVRPVLIMPKKTPVSIEKGTKFESLKISAKMGGIEEDSSRNEEEVSKDASSPLDDGFRNDNDENDSTVDHNDVENPSSEKGVSEDCDNSGADEIQINLNSIANKGKSFKFAIPGPAAGSVTLNFSAEALREMRNSYIMNNKSTAQSTEVTHKVMEEEEASRCTVDSPIISKRKLETCNGVPAFKRRMKRDKKNKNVEERRNKSIFKCSLCSQSFPSKKSLEKHGNFHLEKSLTSCVDCGKIFSKKWALEQHRAFNHNTEASASCTDCGKVFRWQRNLLAHVLLHHPKEIRYRCRYCPLTFLKKKIYIYHHRNKHKEKPLTWCELCFQVFENAKSQEDHQCEGLENNGERIICHRSHPAAEPSNKIFKFSNLKDVQEHFGTFHPKEKVDYQIKSSCPVCQKKFLLRRYLYIHLRRFHDHENNSKIEEKRLKYPCRICDKTFLYEADRSSHENVHRAEKKFPCPDCDKSYFWEKALTSHRKSAHESGDLEFRCDICGKTLSNKYKLKYHMTVHSNVKHFTCGVCGIKFKAQDNLLRHTKNYHGQQRNGSSVTTADKPPEIKREIELRETPNSTVHNI